MSGKKAEVVKKMETAASQASNRPNINMWPAPVTDYIARYDEAAKQRLDNINDKLKNLERQMEVLEAEMNRANGYQRMAMEAPSSLD